MDRSRTVNKPLVRPDIASTQLLLRSLFCLQSLSVRRDVHLAIVPRRSQSRHRKSLRAVIARGLSVFMARLITKEIEAALRSAALDNYSWS